MKLSTRTRYGVRILLDLAASEGKTTLSNIAEKQHISHSYLQHLIAPLVTAGIISSSRGYGGGLWLSRSHEQVSLSDVLQLLEGNALVIDCVKQPQICHRSDVCSTRKIWVRLERSIIDTLDAINMDELVVQESEEKEYQCIKR